MLSPLVTVVVPVGNLDGTIDTSVPGVEQIIWVEGRADEPGGSTDEPSSAYVHVAPGGFATVRFREQGPHPQDDVEDQQPADQEQRAAEYDSTEEFEAFMNQAVRGDDELPYVPGRATEEFEAFMNQAVHGDDELPHGRGRATEEFEAFMNQPVHGEDELPHVRRASALDHARLYGAFAERYEIMFCDRMDPTASWSASRKVASLLSMWVTDHINGDTVTHFDIGPHRTVRDLLADSMQFQLVFMQTAHHFHDLVLPATVRLQTAVRKRRRVFFAFLFSPMRA
jgi:hypothetical protein